MYPPLVKQGIMHNFCSETKCAYLRNFYVVNRRKLNFVKTKKSPIFLFPNVHIETVYFNRLSIFSPIQFPFYLL